LKDQQPLMKSNYKRMPIRSNWYNSYSLKLGYKKGAE